MVEGHSDAEIKHHEPKRKLGDVSLEDDNPKSKQKSRPDSSVDTQNEDQLNNQQAVATEAPGTVDAPKDSHDMKNGLSDMDDDVLVDQPLVGDIAAEASPPAEVDPTRVDDAVDQAQQAEGGAGGSGGNNDAIPAVPSESKTYRETKEEMKKLIELQDSIDPSLSWDNFPNHLGQGASARLFSLATLHLSPLASTDAVPLAAVRQLPANSNKVLLGAPSNCDLYQQRVIRALARKVGARFLVVDPTTLHLESSSDTAPAGVSPEDKAVIYDDPDDMSLSRSPEPLTFDDDDFEDFRPRLKTKAFKRAPHPADFLSSKSPPTRFPSRLEDEPAADDKDAKKDEEKEEPEKKKEAEATDDDKAAPKAAGDESKEEAKEGNSTMGQDIGPNTEDAEPEVAAKPPPRKIARASATPMRPSRYDYFDLEADLWPSYTPYKSSDKYVPSWAEIDKLELERNKAKEAYEKTLEKAEAAKPSTLKVGDRVQYIGKASARSNSSLDALQQAIARVEGGRQGSSRSSLRDILPALIMRRNTAIVSMSGKPPRGASENCPSINSKGRVVAATSIKNVEVAFDESFPGAVAMPGEKSGYKYTCSEAELQKVEDKEDSWLETMEAIFSVIKEEVEKGEPLVVFLQNFDRLVHVDQSDHNKRLESLLSDLPARCLIVAAYCTRHLSREQKSSMSSMSMLFGGRGSGEFAAMDEPSSSWMDGPLGRRSIQKMRKSPKGTLLARLFPCSIELHPPNQDNKAKSWRQMVEADIADTREVGNRAALKKALDKCGVECLDIDEVCIREATLGKTEVDQIIGGAITEMLVSGDIVAADTVMEAVQEESNGGENTKPNALLIKAVHIKAAADAVIKNREESNPAPERHSLKDIQADQYEKQLLSEVIPPEEIAVGFNDIGALDAIKDTLHELVILPLQRPELFTRGTLTKPNKGVLLFGPPGTGKTMLAKAIASESGAHFINVNMSSITSKWFGEGERLVKALFSLAHKLAPSVIFIDEVDSFLGKRGGAQHEHEALRKQKNEFMQHLDGLRTSQHDRVLVLAATNRPMDLDDAVIRRLPRRIMVPLPDAANRERILGVMLKDEELDKDLNLADIAQNTDGYSGSDLKNMAIAAAYCPIRELLAAEKARVQEGTKETVVAPTLRPITMADFEAATKQVGPSMHHGSAALSELDAWNTQYGEGGSRQQQLLHYYT